jgi:DNA repair exonuclease SbcCD ATPase subunit
MLLRRIRICNFRKLVSPLVIEGLGAGLTVIAGDNEEGKSTLLAAIRAGLFERHNLGGKELAKMQPYSSRVRPEIRLDFEIDGRAYRLTKAFDQRPFARLETPGGTFEGAAAEDELAKLLQFRVPQRESKPDDQGLLGLFWLEQGRPLDTLGFGETGRSTLRASLERDIGDVLGGTRSRRLMAAAKRRRDALLTATGKPKTGGDLAAAIAEAEDTMGRVKQLEADCRDYERDIDVLERIQTELDEIRAQRRVETAGQALAEAEAEAKKIEELRRSDEAAAGTFALAEAELRCARDRLTERRTLIDALGNRTTLLAGAREAWACLDAQSDEVARSLEGARSAFDTIVGAREAAEVRLALAAARARFEALEAGIAELDRRIFNVEELAGKRDAATVKLASISINEAAVLAMEDQERTAREARVAIAAAATRLRFVPSDRQTVTKDGTELRAEERSM